MLRTNVEHHSFHMLRVWITDDEVRANVRKWFADYLLELNIDHDGEIEIPYDSFMETIDNASYVGLIKGSFLTIGMILRCLEGDDRDLAGVIFAKKEEDVEKPDEK